MNGLPYYPRYPRDFFDGTNGMTFELKGAYAMLLDLIYMCGGQLYDEPRFIAGHMNCSVRAWGGYRAALIERGKIRVEDGIISNFRADKELIIQRSFQDKQRINASQPRKIKDLSEATAQPKPSHTDTDTDTDTEETVAKATDASVDFAKQLWDRGVAFLGRHGTPDKQARTLIGKWRKAYQDTDIFEAFAACSKEGVIDPVPWITAKLSGKGKANGTDKQQRKLDAFIAGSTGSPPVDRGPDLYPAVPLLARG
jgi:uncharacterized protein YdaU (DUF1376 family)